VGSGLNGGQDKECAGGALDGKGKAWICLQKLSGRNIQGKRREEGKKTREPLREMGTKRSFPYALCDNAATGLKKIPQRA